MLSLLLLACAGPATELQAPLLGVDPSVTPAPMPQVNPDLPPPAATDSAPAPQAVELSPAAAANNAFAAELYAVLPAQENLFFSPACVETALAMTLAGAQGETKAALESGLHLGFEGAHAQLGDWLKELNSTRGAFTLRIVNRLWPAQDLSLKQDFMYTTEAAYASDFRTLDYGNPEAARETINRWVELQTQDRIKDLVPQGALSPATRLVLTNAVYFLANWAQPFDASDTYPQPFHLEDGEVQVPFMHALGSRRVHMGERASVLVLPYQEGHQELILAVPLGEATVASLGVEVLTQGAAQAAPVRINLALPKLEMGWGASLSTPLSELGLGPAFADSADFGAMSDEPLFIDEVMHKAFVKMDEQGTEAAAATAIVMKATSMPMPAQVDFVVDRPYLFAIRDVNSGALLFVGRVMDPSAG